MNTVLFKKKFPLKYLIPAIPLLLFTVCFFLFPILLMVNYSLYHSLPYGEIEKTFTFENYFNFFTDIYYVKVLIKSFLLGLAVSIVTIPLGYIVAYALWKSKGMKRKILYICILLPLFTNLVVRLYGWRIILSPAGPVSGFLQKIGLADQGVNMLFTWPTIVLGLFSECAPYYILILFSVLTLINPRYLDAAFDLGATRIETFFKVIWPLSLSGVISGGLIVYIWSFGAFATPTILGNAKHWTLAVHAERQILSLRDWPYGSAFGIIILFFTLLIVFAQTKLLKRKQMYREI
ncbi:MAG: ABC transporter permease [Desulfohalobiaceae bacterium]|nr:ABC transporter permease [Desulfohalobiaceae bacterium]